MKRILISLISLMMVLSLAAVSSAESTDPSAALTEAQTAYAAAKQTSSMTDYEAELKTMVENGSLTQEQADLLLTAAKESNALRNGVCPSCGCQLQSASGKGGYGCGKVGRTMKNAGGVTTAAAASGETELEQAQTAYAAARQANRMTDYEAELSAMVEAGTLTQEQADLLLNAAKEAEALANGTCPSCGYSFQTTTGHTAGNGYGMKNNNGTKNGNGRGGKR